MTTHAVPRDLIVSTVVALRGEAPSAADVDLLIDALGQILDDPETEARRFETVRLAHRFGGDDSPDFAVVDRTVTEHGIAGTAVAVSDYMDALYVARIANRYQDEWDAPFDDKDAF